MYELLTFHPSSFSFGGQQSTYNNYKIPKCIPDGHYKPQSGGTMTSRCDGSGTKHVLNGKPKLRRTAIDTSNRTAKISLEVPFYLPFGLMKARAVFFPETTKTFNRYVECEVTGSYANIQRENTVLFGDDSMEPGGAGPFATSGVLSNAALPEDPVKNCELPEATEPGKWMLGYLKIEDHNGTVKNYCKASICSNAVYSNCSGCQDEMELDNVEFDANPTWTLVTKPRLLNAYRIVNGAQSVNNVPVGTNSYLSGTQCTDLMTDPPRRYHNEEGGLADILLCNGEYFYQYETQTGPQAKEFIEKTYTMSRGDAWKNTNNSDYFTMNPNPASTTTAPPVTTAAPGGNTTNGTNGTRLL